MSSQSICVVDDNEDHRFLLRYVFKQHLSTYAVHFFSGGQALFDELPSLDQPPSLIILDRHMPILNGYQVLTTLKQNAVYRMIPVVMVSSDASEEEINECYETGVSSFVMKPIGMSSMIESMTLICDYWMKLNQKQTR